MPRDLRFTHRLISSLWMYCTILQNSHSRSLNDDAQRPNKGSEPLDKPTQTPYPLRQFINFVDGQCPPVLQRPTGNVNDNNCQKFCSSDMDCKEDNKCCQYGCSFTCMEPWFPGQVVDWAKPSSNGISEDPKLHEGAVLSSRGEPCSTSILDGMEPMRCPKHYSCFITMDEDTQLNIPNRGECVLSGAQDVSRSRKESEARVHPNHNKAECFYLGRTHKHEKKFKEDCNVCVCYNGVVFCERNFCPVKIGIPGTATNFEHFKTTKYVGTGEDNPSKLTFDDTEDGSGSTRSEIDDEDLSSGEDNLKEMNEVIEGIEKYLKSTNRSITQEIIDSVRARFKNVNLAANNSRLTKTDLAKMISSEFEKTSETKETDSQRPITTIDGDAYLYSTEGPQDRKKETGATFKKHFPNNDGSSASQESSRPKGFDLEERLFKTDGFVEVIRLKGGGYKSSGDDDSESGSTQNEDTEETSTSSDGSASEWVHREKPNSKGESFEVSGSERIGTIALARWKATENSGDDSEFGVEKNDEEYDPGSTQKEKNEGTAEGSTKKDVGSTPKNFFDPAKVARDAIFEKSFEYMATTDDER